MIEISADTGWAMTGEALLRRAPQDAAQGRAGREPGEPDRHHDAPEALARPDRGGGRGGHPLHLRTKSITGLDYAFPAETAVQFSDNAR